MEREQAAACVCGWPETECLRRVLGNGPPFPPEPCEPKAGVSTAAQGRFEATISPAVEYGTERPCEIGRITYTAGVHRYVALTFRYTDADDAWRLTWIGHDGTHDAAQLPEGVYPSAAMLEALAVAPVEEVPEAR